MQNKRRVRILIQEVEKGKSLGGQYISTYILEPELVYREVKRLIERLENKAMNKTVLSDEAQSTHVAS